MTSSGKQITSDNPIKYKDWLIYSGDAWERKYGGNWLYIHKEYDGPGNHDIGTEKTLEDCIDSIEEKEAERDNFVPLRTIQITNMKSINDGTEYS